MHYKKTAIFDHLKKYGNRYGFKETGESRLSWLSEDDHAFALLYGDGKTDEEVAASQERGLTPGQVARTRKRLVARGILEAVERQDIAETSSAAVVQPDSPDEAVVVDAGDSDAHRPPELPSGDEVIKKDSGAVSGMESVDWMALTRDDDSMDEESVRRIRRQKILKHISERGGRFPGGAQARGTDKNEAGESERKRGYRLFSFSIGPLIHLGAFAARFLERPWALWGSGGLLGMVLLFFWMHRDEVVNDFFYTTNYWSLLQRLIVILFVVNATEAIVAAGALFRITGNRPKVNVDIAFTIVHMVPWIFLGVEPSEIKKIKEKPERMRVVASRLFTLIWLVLASGLVWAVSRRSGTMLPVYAMELNVLAWIFLAFSVNPFGKSDLTRIVSSHYGLPVRSLAFQALFKSDSKAREYPASVFWALRLYAIACLLFIVIVTSVIAYHAIGWLSEKWGGLGIAYACAILLFLAYYPLAKLSRAVWGSVESSLGSSGQVVTGRRLLIVAVVGIVLIIPYSYEASGQFELLPSRKVEIHPNFEGEVRAILVKEGDWVEQGDVIAILADEQQRRDVAEYRGRVDEVEANLRKALNGATPEKIAVARQALAQATTRYRYSQQTVDRYGELLLREFISVQAFSDKELLARNDFESMELARRNLEEILAGTRQEDVDVLKAQLVQEKSKLVYHTSQLEFTRIRAPFRGQVVSGSLMFSVGDHLVPEDKLMAIEDNREQSVQVKVPETDIAILPKQANVRFRTWSLPETVFSGEIKEIAPSADAEQYWRVVRVLISFDNSESRFPSGLTGYAKIECERMPLIQAFTRMLSRFVFVEIWAWIP